MPHTVGPWTYSCDRWPNGDFNGRPYIYASQAVEDGTHGRHVAELCTVADVEANARLIAAAPELLDALKQTLDALYNETHGDRSPWIQSVIACADAAIVKATGGQHAD